MKTKSKKVSVLKQMKAELATMIEGFQISGTVNPVVAKKVYDRTIKAMWRKDATNGDYIYVAALLLQSMLSVTD